MATSSIDFRPTPLVTNLISSNSTPLATNLIGSTLMAIILPIDYTNDHQPTIQTQFPFLF